MQKNSLYIVLALSISLFVYLFFRTEETVITQLFKALISSKNYVYLKNMIDNHIALPSFVIYSLPEGLWVFVATIFSKNIIFEKGEFYFEAIYIPLIFAIGLEFLQLIHVTHGMFDFLDILVSVLFWSVANYLLNYPQEKQNLLTFKINRESLYFFSSYAIVYFSYVPSS